MKRWIVRTEYMSSYTFVAFKLGYYRFMRKPNVWERRYHWRWMAVLSALSDNMFTASHNPFVFGAYRSVVIDTKEKAS